MAIDWRTSQIRNALVAAFHEGRDLLLLSNRFCLESLYAAAFDFHLNDSRLQWIDLETCGRMYVSAEEGNDGCLVIWADGTLDLRSFKALRKSFGIYGKTIELTKDGIIAAEGIGFLPEAV